MKHLIFSIIFSVIFFKILFLSTGLFARDNSRLQNLFPSSYDYKQIDINNISAWITNRGSLFNKPTANESGLEWPKGSGIYAVYASGLWMGAKVNGEVRVALAEYSYEFGPGSIDPLTHLPNNPDDPRYVVYKFNNGDMIPQQAIEDGCPDEVLGDQMLWCVYNDADPAYHVNMATAPLGVEIQQTIFAWDTLAGPLENLVILRWLIINKSGQTLDSAYISMWNDPDLGDAGDDLMGCDTTRSLAFCYNGSNIDAEYGIRPPAIGFDFLQGPIVPTPGDSAIYLGKRVSNYKNLPLTSFVWLNSTNENNGLPQTGEEVYFFMQARWRDGSHMTYGGNGNYPNNPLTNFMYSGDPESGTGWLDWGPADRHFMMSSGPFTMMPGDSQEVVMGILLSRGGSNLNSVTTLKQQDEIVQTFYNSLFNLFPPVVLVNTDFPNPTQTDIKVKTDIPQANHVTADLYSHSGSLVASLDLFDDGLHNDKNANDNIWGNHILINSQLDPVYLNLNVSYQGYGNITWSNIKSNIPVAGLVNLPSVILGADNINRDGFVNPGEVIRYTLNVQNHSAFDLSNVRIEQLAAVETDYVHDLMTPYWHKVFPLLNGNQTASWRYDRDSVYFQFSLSPNTPPNDSIHIVFRISDNNVNVWYDTIAFDIQPFLNIPQSDTVNAVKGSTRGRFEYTILDPKLISGDTYRINVHEHSDDLVFDLEDYTINNTLLLNIPFPDIYGFYGPIINGFKITIGTASKQAFASSWEWEPADQRWLSGQYHGGQIFFGAIFLGGNFFGSLLKPWEYKPVLIKFDSTLSTNCKVYRRDLGYAVQPGLGTFYGEAYDVYDPNNPRRLNIVFVEDNSRKPADMIWNLAEIDDDREYLFIMASDYDSISAGGYNNVNFGPEADVYFAYWPILKPGHTFLESPGELKLFVNPQLVHDGDVFEFTPAREQEPVPEPYELKQNFPNPFNSGTTIRFSITQNVRVRLEIFNILGQRVKTLINETMTADDHQIKWDGRNESGDLLGSGIYFYRLRAGNFIKTRKMIFLK